MHFAFILNGFGQKMNNLLNRGGRNKQSGGTKVFKVKNFLEGLNKEVERNLRNQ